MTENKINLDDIRDEEVDKLVEELENKTKEKIGQTFKGAQNNLFAEEEDDVVEGEIEIDLEDDVETDTVTQAEEEENPKEKAKKEKKEENSRSSERIRQLNAEKKERERQLAEKEAELEELKSKLVERENKTLEAQKGELEQKKTNVIAELRKAKEEADIDKEIEHTAELQKIVFALQLIEVNKKEVPEKKEDKKETRAPTQERPYPAQQDSEPEAEAWATRNKDWWGKDPRKTQMALVINRELIEEGADPSSAEFYERIDEELSSVFGGTKKEDPKPKPKAPATASPSRAASPATKAKQRVTLTENDVRLIKKYNLDPKQYARDKLNSEASRSRTIID